jgi:hypothetical protein
MYSISGTGIGAIHLGITLDEARKLLPNAKFERSSDGEGAALIDVRMGAEPYMTLYADEENQTAWIDWSKKITFMETFNPNCHTENGVHPGSPVEDAEKAFGKIKEIIRSEIESRETILFSHQPPKITFRIDYTGIFMPDSSRTTKYDPKGKIYSISVSSRN